jgi:hypothetical protein
MTDQQIEAAVSQKVLRMSLVDRQARYLELARKVASMVILSEAELAELILLGSEERPQNRYFKQ